MTEDDKGVNDIEKIQDPVAKQYVQNAYKSMQAGYTQKTQALAEQRKQLDKIGGVAYLASLDLELPDLGRLDSYVEIVKERSIRRRLILSRGSS